MVRYDMKLAAPESPCSKQYRSHWRVVVLAIGLSLLIACGIGVDVPGRVDIVPPFDWYLQPAPLYLLMVHYGRNVPYIPKSAVSPRSALLSARGQHYVFSVYVQMPGRRSAHFWLL
jgi:hypothetical protein